MITTCPTLRIILHTGRGIRPVVLTGITFRNSGRPSFNAYPWKNQAYSRITSVYNCTSRRHYCSAGFHDDDALSCTQYRLHNPNESLPSSSLHSPHKG